MRVYRCRKPIVKETLSRPIPIRFREELTQQTRSADTAVPTSWRTPWVNLKLNPTRQPRPSGQGKAACTTLCQSSFGKPSCRPGGLELKQIIITTPGNHGQYFWGLTIPKYKLTKLHAWSVSIRKLHRYLDFWTDSFCKEGNETWWNMMNHDYNTLQNIKTHHIEHNKKNVWSEGRALKHKHILYAYIYILIYSMPVLL